MSEPAKKNEFLSDLELLDAGQMKPKVCPKTALLT